jgi:hypothetical protein
MGKFSTDLLVKPCIHDASWLARVKSRECPPRRFIQVMESSAGWRLKRVATSTTLQLGDQELATARNA